MLQRIEDGSTKLHHKHRYILAMTCPLEFRLYTRRLCPEFRHAINDGLCLSFHPPKQHFACWDILQEICQTTGPQ
jgi:hypothetical protein